MQLNDFLGKMFDKTMDKRLLNIKKFTCKASQIASMDIYGDDKTI